MREIWKDTTEVQTFICNLIYVTFRFGYLVFDIWFEHLGSKQPYSCITQGIFFFSLNSATVVEDIPETFDTVTSDIILQKDQVHLCFIRS